MALFHFQPAAISRPYRRFNGPRRALMPLFITQPFGIYSPRKCHFTDRIVFFVLTPAVKSRFSVVTHDNVYLTGMNLQ